MEGDGGATRRKMGAAFTAIIAFKVLKGLTFFVFGIAALKLSRAPAMPSALQIADYLSVSRENALVHRVADILSRITPGQATALGIASLVVAAVFLIEGACLAAQLWWSTYFTITLTALGIPLEVYEIAHRPESIRRYVLLLINLAILGFLWARRDEFRRGRSAAART